MVIILALLGALTAAPARADAAGTYDAALAAVKGVDDAKIREAEGKELDALLARPADAAFLADPRVAALLGPNQPAVELFRAATNAPNDGYLLAPKVETYNSKTPIPQLFKHLKLVKLLLLDAKLAAAKAKPRRVESDLLAAVGFMVQVSEQKSGALISALVEQLAFEKAYAPLSDSARGRTASPAYLKELSARLDLLARNQDFMRAAFLEEAERGKGSLREGITPESVAKGRDKLPFIKRLVAEKYQDAEYVAMVVAQLEAATDARTQAIVSSFRANDHAPLADYQKKLDEELLAHKTEREALGLWAQFQDGLSGGKNAKRVMADATADILLRIAAPDYSKLIPRCHAFLSELSVLRAGLAVELYARERKRPPDNLAQLVPAYLPAVPQDSFNRFSPLRYVPSGKKFFVYGFGPDGKDHGGVALDLDAFMSDGSRDVGDFVYRD